MIITLRHFFKSIYYIFLILLASIFFIFWTEPGLYVSFYVAQKVVPGKLSFEKVHGYLLGNFSIEKFQYKDQTQDKNININADALSLKWTPTSLWHNQLAIQSLLVKQLQINDITIKNIQLSGNIKNVFDAMPKFSALATWENVSTNNLNTSGSANISGNFEQYQGQLDATLTAADKKVYPVKANIQASEKTLQAKIIAGDKKFLLGQLTLEGQRSPVFNIHWTLAIPKLEQLTPVIGKVDAQGSIQGLPNDFNFTAKITGNDMVSQKLIIRKIISNITLQHIQTKKMSAELDINLNPGDLLYDDGIKKNKIPFKKLTMKMLWKSHILKANTEWVFDAAKHFEGHVIIQPLDLKTLDLQHLERQHLSGELLFAMSNLDFINDPASPLKKIQGTLNAKFKLAGTLAKPLWDGMGIIKARGEVPDLGLVFNSMDLELKSNPKDMTLSGKITSGKNVLSIVGESKAPFTNGFNAKITGNNFLLMNTKEYQITMSPDLKIQWIKNNDQPGKITIDGTIDIPSANIQPLEFTQSLQLPSDVVFVSDKETETTMMPQVESHIQVRLGDAVKINTHGVTGKLVGTVMVVDENNEPTTGQGKIQIIDGQYDAYGQKLIIDKGEANFNAGPIDNPQLFVRAIRTFNSNNNSTAMTAADIATEAPVTQFNKITVGVEVSGYLNNPIVRLFSEPATLSQSDILSFLIIGQPMSQASSSDGALLMRALSALNVGTGESTQIMQQLQQTFGLDVLDVETASQYNSSQNTMTNSTALVIGKKLSSKLFVDYSIGLMQGTNVLKVKYLLAPRWMFQTETDGSNEGVDIIYSITKD